MKQFIQFILITMLFLVLTGCSEKYPNRTESSIPVIAGSNCAVCHLDKELLKEIATPLPPQPPDSGEG